MATTKAQHNTKFQLMATTKATISNITCRVQLHRHLELLILYIRVRLLGVVAHINHPVYTVTALPLGAPTAICEVTVVHCHPILLAVLRILMGYLERANCLLVSMIT